MNLKLPTIPTNTPQIQKVVCKLCGSDKDLMTSGYCFNCEEELENETNKGKRSNNKDHNK